MTEPLIDLPGNAYLWIKALHIVSVMAWMAGLLYLPRLFVYHVDAAPGSVQSETFKVMERRLMRAIMEPARIAALVFGLLMLAADPAIWLEPWLLAKATLVILLFGLHDMMNGWRKAFAADRNEKSAKFFRIVNEVPTVMMIVIVVLVVVKPF